MPSLQKRAEASGIPRSAKEGGDEKMTEERERLEVEILKRFKKDLILRVSPREKGENTVHYANCPLCVEYYHDKILSCTKCPFQRFEGRGVFLGCVNWIRLVIGKNINFSLRWDSIFWYSKDRVATMKQLRLLRKRGKELVKWI